MRTQLNILKETNPELGHKEMFKLATEKVRRGGEKEEKAGVCKVAEGPERGG